MHTRIDIIVYIIIPAPVVFPFADQATSHAAPPVAHRARRGVHPRFYARWRLSQLYSAAARRAPEWFAENRRTLISPRRAISKSGFTFARRRSSSDTAAR